jgi:hypothetical protein
VLGELGILEMNASEREWRIDMVRGGAGGDKRMEGKEKVGSAWNVIRETAG